MAERETQLGTSLRDQGVAPRLAHEAVAHLIPKRSIETWVLCLNGQPVDETTDYKQRADNSQIPDAANAFFAWSRTNATVPAICIPSLRTAIPEIRRIAPK
ncbi:MAG: hypothetical protein HY858_13535 [Candidatus Solibacter usitatus]|nr:hypothetical protein [Candidatus Solibacter usitatus]